jgi:hypothetical protein
VRPGARFVAIPTAVSPGMATQRRPAAPVPVTEPRRRAGIFVTRRRGMQSIEGMVAIVQKGRFQLLDDDGVGHFFVLGYHAAMEPEQLPSLLRRRVRVRFSDPPDVIGHCAHRLLLLDAS